MAFLAAAASEPAGLVAEGEPGIGKTTLCLSAVELARRARVPGVVGQARRGGVGARLRLARGFAFGRRARRYSRDLTDPPAARRSIEFYCARMPRTLSTDQRAVGAGFAVGGRAARRDRLRCWWRSTTCSGSTRRAETSSRSPLDGSRRQGRRVRHGPDRSRRQRRSGAPGCSCRRPDGVQRMQMRPLSLGGVERCHHPATRALLVAAGNRSDTRGFGQAIRSMRSSWRARWTATHEARDMPLPMTLTELVRARIGSLDESARDVLLAMACHAAPTVEVVSRATGTDAEDVVEQLEDVEGKGIVGIDGHRLGSHTRCWPGVSTPMRHRRAAGRCTAGWRRSSTNRS